MGELRAGVGPALVISGLAVLAGVLVLAVGDGSGNGLFGWVLIAVGVVFSGVNLAFLRRGR